MGDFSINDIDDVIHGRLRLGIMAFLIGAGRASFKAIASELEASDGNLSVHLRKLEEAGYIRIEKCFVDRKPLTEAVMTDAGRTAFINYLDAMSKLAAV